MTRPAGDVRDPKTTPEHAELATAERPVVGVPLLTAVTSEDDQGVVALAATLESPDHLADGLVEVLDHLDVLVQGAAVAV